jgi:TfoX/Sxy family transcriptional regulator of competence genes
VSEVKMFGGIGFMLNGNMVVAASDRGLLVRVGKDGAAEACARPGAAPMIMNGREMAGYVRVAGIPSTRAR